MEQTRKQAATFTIADFSRADREVLRAAFEARLPMAYIGMRAGHLNSRTSSPYVLAVGHPGAIALPESAPEGSIPYSLKRIKGIDKPPDSEPSEFVRNLLKG